MHSHSRSRDATLSNKSCKLRSAQTKNQSTVSSSPKPKKPPSSKVQQKSSKSPKCPKSIIKSAGKLNQFLNKITQKLQEFDKQSVLETPSTSSDISINDSKILSSVSYNSNEQEDYRKFNKSTALIIDKIKSENETASKIKDEKPFSNAKNQQEIGKNLQKYRVDFDQVLSRPHCLSNFVVKKRRFAETRRNSIVSEFREFRRQQCENWKQINSQLKTYLSNKHQSSKQQSYKKIQQKLLKQGKSNYRWLQMQQKLSLQDFQRISRQANKIQIDKHIKISNHKQEQQQEQQREKQKCIHDQPLQPMLLKNYNWEKYIWEDEASSTSDLQCNSRVNSEVQYLHINPQDLVDETDQVQENVQLIMGWLLDEFVVELAHKLDANSLASKSSQKPQKSPKIQDQQDKSFLQTISQICQDSNIIRSLGQNPTHKLPDFYQDALLQQKLYTPGLSTKDIKQELIKIICNREVEVHELFLLEEEEQFQWIKMSYLYQLEEVIWEGLLMEEVCRLWMG